jgi:hypothetical protein
LEIKKDYIEKEVDRFSTLKRIYLIIMVLPKK